MFMIVCPTSMSSNWASFSEITEGIVIVTKDVIKHSPKACIEQCMLEQNFDAIVI